MARLLRDIVRGTTTISYDIGGNVTRVVLPDGTAADTNYQLTTNYAAPSAITANGLTDNLQWSVFLGLTQNTGPNGEVSVTTYDHFARPETSTSATGAVTSYTYSSAAPWTVTATTNGRWVKKTLDGFGRTVKSEAGNGSTTVSVTETLYAQCACSPMGKVWKVSMPYAPGAANVYWTEYLYDALGRTVSVRMPDGVSVKGHEYAGNKVKSTDEAGEWKRFTMNGLGNLVTVEEPKPAADTSQAGNYFTNYTYDLLNHLTQVTMPRGDGASLVTQTRTFNYGTPPGPDLLSATNPENGIVSYTYYTGGLLASKTDAKGLVTIYGYDASKRLTQIQHYPSVNTPEDVTARVDISYDTNPYDPSYPEFALGRMTARKYTVNGMEFAEMYGYTPAGLTKKKRLRVSKTFEEPYPYPQSTASKDLDASWVYDGEGKVLSVTYPTAMTGAWPPYIRAAGRRTRPGTMPWGGRSVWVLW